jgi:GxxExxY protein
MEVHKVLGCGFLESVYQEALAIELQQQGIPFEREKEFDITYKSLILPKTYKVDFLCYEHIIVELKALNSAYSRQYSPDHQLSESFESKSRTAYQLWCSKSPTSTL